MQSLRDSQNDGHPAGGTERTVAQRAERAGKSRSAGSVGAFAFLQSSEFTEALQAEAHARARKMIEGVQHYQALELLREETPHRVIWRKANAQLLDYGGNQDAPAILCVPSLINKHTILDLYPERSLVRYLRDEGFRVLILDWDTPGSREKRYGCAQYVDYLLLDALSALAAQHRGPIHLLGYCMGGLFALAAAQLRPELVDGLILLATPWQRIAAPTLSDAQWERFARYLREQETIHPLITQTLFHLLDPWHFQNKFSRFTELSASEQRHFAHVEQWANDGVPLSRYVAHECYIDWPRRNYFADGSWRIRGTVIDPGQIECPAFIATPTQDRIVPLHSSEPLTRLIPRAESLSPKCGHISMVVGKQAKRALWEPLVGWLKQ